MNDNKEEPGSICLQSGEETRRSNLQPVTRVGGEERAAEHQDAPQNIFLGHLEMKVWGGGGLGGHRDLR